MNILKEFAEKARTKKKTVLFPEGTDARILQAALILCREKIARPVILGTPGEISELAKKNNISVSGIEVIDPLSYPCLEELVALYCANRRNIKRAVALKLLRKNLVFGGMLLASGRIDTMVAGAASTTANVIRAAALTTGYAENITAPSSFFIMSFPEKKNLFFADCAVNIAPDSRQLAEIAVTTAESFVKLTGEAPRVAFLSFSTRGSASHPLAEKVREAVSFARAMRSNIFFDGEFQADTALSENVAKRKLKDASEVAGRANVLIFPDLNSGNIGYKLTQYLGGASALGPILQGFRKPVSDLSRGATVEDIVGVSAITCLLA
ncbi:MAG TPA: phosphate acyltransferase [bacterium]|nr:phosphate acyltransferase [bacterium]